MHMAQSRVARNVDGSGAATLVMEKGKNSADAIHRTSVYPQKCGSTTPTILVSPTLCKSSRLYSAFVVTQAGHTPRSLSPVLLESRLLPRCSQSHRNGVVLEEMLTIPAQTPAFSKKLRTDTKPTPPTRPASKRPSTGNTARILSTTTGP